MININNIFLEIYFIILILYIIIFLGILVKYKILIPLRQIKENMVEKHKYYREKIDKYSPLMNAKLLGKDIFDKDVITAMILYLRNKGWQNNQSFNKKRLKKEDFMENEILFIEYSKHIFIGLNNKKNFKIGNINIKEILDISILNDLKKEKLIKKIPSLKYLSLIDALPIVFILINGIFIGKIGSSNNKFANNLLFIIELLANFSWILIYLISIHFKFNLQANLEKAGHLYVNKLNASKEFLKDFSILSSREIKEELLWESYLRNAILFDLKGNLDKDAEQFYINIISEYKYPYKEKDNTFKIIKDYLGIITMCSIWIFLAFVIKDIIFVLMLANFILVPLLYSYLLKYIYPYNN